MENLSKKFKNFVVLTLMQDKTTKEVYKQWCETRDGAGSFNSMWTADKITEILTQLDFNFQYLIEDDRIPRTDLLRYFQYRLFFMMASYVMLKKGTDWHFNVTDLQGHIHTYSFVPEGTVNANTSSDQTMWRTTLIFSRDGELAHIGGLFFLGAYAYDDWKNWCKPWKHLDEYSFKVSVAGVDVHPNQEFQSVMFKAFNKDFLLSGFNWLESHKTK